MLSRGHLLPLFMESQKMAIGFSRKGGEKFVLIAPNGEECWVQIEETARCRLKFEAPPGWRVYREEVYLRANGNFTGLQPKPIKPALV